MLPPVRFLVASIALSGQMLAVDVTAVPAAANSAELRVREIGVDRGWVAVRLELLDAFDENVRESIASGLPMTVRFTTELWQHRGRWFDHQVRAPVTSFRIQWDPGERVFTLTYPGPPRRDSYEELDPLLAELSQQTVRAHPLGDLEDRHRYFFRVEAAIRPLTLEEFRELDGWIGGRIRGRGEADAPTDGGTDGSGSGEAAAAGPSGGGGVTGAFFGLLVDLAGFGDTIYRTRTALFRPSELRVISSGE